MHDSYQLPSSLKTLVFLPHVRQTLLSYRQEAGANEAGGILLGRVSTEGAATVEIATIPTVLDKAGPTFFLRSRESAQCVVDRAWSNSSGEQVYLGEWHTHPERSPSPSSRDRKMVQNMFRETRMEISFLVTVIVGQAGEWIGMQTVSGLTRLTPTPAKKSSLLYK